MAESRLNIELFKKIRDRIAAVPESYNQSEFYAESSEAPCGTVCCIAGEAIICAAPTVEEGVAELRRLSGVYDPFAIPRRAVELLGLGTDKPHPMFYGYGGGWPYRFRIKFQEAYGYQEKAAAAVAYLDHIIETGKVPE